MNLYLKYRADKMYQKVLSEHLTAFDISYKLLNEHTVVINGNIEETDFDKLKNSLSAYGIEVLDDLRAALIQNIKSLIKDAIYHPEKTGNQKVSAYLAGRLSYSYSYISKLFSKFTYYSIEQFIILKKIEVAKTLIIEDHYSLTEIAYKLNYSSVAHLSKQFKKTTGLTPTDFYKLIKKREEYASNLNG